MITLIHPDRYPNGISFGHEMMTVLELHRAISEQTESFDDSSPDKLSIVDEAASERYTDQIIRIRKPYYLTDESFYLLKEGVIVQLDDEHWSSGPISF
jgi:hypothetical protein